MREAVSKAAVSTADIVSIGVDTTCCSVVALDANVRERGGGGTAQAKMWGTRAHGEEGGGRGGIHAFPWCHWHRFLYLDCDCLSLYKERKTF